jgi:hypothetical protein
VTFQRRIVNPHVATFPLVRGTENGPGRPWAAARLGPGVDPWRWPATAGTRFLAAGNRPSVRPRRRAGQGIGCVMAPGQSNERR